MCADLCQIFQFEDSIWGISRTPDLNPFNLSDFLHKQGKESMIDDLLAAGMNFTLDSTNLLDHGMDISEKLVGLCGNPTFKKAPLLLNRVLEKCPNTLLAEDKVKVLEF